MAGFIAVRLARMAATLLLLITFVYVAMSFAPGDVVANIAGPGSTLEFQAAVRASLGLDQPLPVQYVRYLGNLVRGDLGVSWRTGRPVWSETSKAIQYTAQLATVAMLIGTFVGVAVGVVAAKNHNRGLDRLCMALAIVGISMPIFVLNLVAIYVFAFRLGWFPTSGADSPTSVVLPATTLGLFVAAVIARMVRSAVLDVLRQDYIRAARAKGLREWGIVFKHALPNAAIPTVTIIGVQFGLLLGGSVITETVFAWPGLGQMIITAVKYRDTPAAQTGIMFFAGGFMLVNLAVDVAYHYLDPRLRARRS